jgi:hypothetical protein
VPWHFMNFLFILQKQNVEKAKATLLNENLDGSTSVTDNKQSDHLLLVIAYDKWSRILLQVINYFFFCNNTPFLLFGSFWCVCTILLYTNFFLYMICVVGRSYYETAAGRISNKMVFEFQNGAKSARQFCHSFYLNNTVMHMIRFISSEVKSVYIYICIYMKNDFYFLYSSEDIWMCSGTSFKISVVIRYWILHFFLVLEII